MNTKPDTWKRIASETIADCRIFKVRKDLSARESDGAEHNFYVLETSDWVNIIPVTKDRHVVMIKQFRHGTENITLEIPGGMVDDEENAEFAATRELLEETGYKSNEVRFLGKSHPNPAIQANTVYHFLALNCEKIREIEFDTTESIETNLVPLDKIPEMIKRGEVTHSLVLNAFYWYSLSSSPTVKEG